MLETRGEPAVTLAQPPGQQAVSDAKDVSHTWAGMHRPAATRGMSQTPTGTAHIGGLTPRDRADTQTARAHTAPARPHRRPPAPGPPTRRTPTQRPDTDQATSITWEAVHLRSQELTLCRPLASVCVCVCMGARRDHLRGPSPAPHPTSPIPSPGSQPRTQASNHSSPLLPGEMGGCTQIAAGHPVAFSANSSWEGPPRSAQPPGHHLDSQAWGSPTAIAAG